MMSQLLAKKKFNETFNTTCSYCEQDTVVQFDDGSKFCLHCGWL